MSIVIFIIILLVLVLVHEAGHFFMAKRFGIRVDEFGFGFPPKLFSRKYGETEYSLNLLPIGGFVKIFGENPEEDSINGPDAHRSFINKPKWQQVIVLLAGVVANFLLAWLLFSIGFMTGLPSSVGSTLPGAVLSDVSLVVVGVAPKSPAENAGLKVGDKIVSIKSGANSTTDVSAETVQSFVKESGGKEIDIGYTRGKDSKLNLTKVTPVVNKAENKLQIGISMDQEGIARLPFFTAIKQGMLLDLFMSKTTLVGLYTLIRDAIHGKGSFSSLSGPVGMVAIVNEAYQFGFVYLMSFAALISINLAIINLIPFPALDGGRLLFLLIEKIKGSRINPKITNTANMIGFWFLILLMVIITYHDVVKLF